MFGSVMINPVMLQRRPFGAVSADNQASSPLNPQIKKILEHKLRPPVRACKKSIMSISKGRLY
jgi:hypothetical protein